MRLKQDKRGISNVVVFVLGLVIIVVVVSNIFLWNYEMNQLDWEKMHEEVSIVNATSITDTWSCNPSEYSLGGSTSNVSGSISDLTSDDEIYMTFRSYYSGTDTSDFVDQTCNLYPPPPKGTHSNFPAQQAGPDSVYDMLTEENTVESSNSTLLDDGFEAVDWDADWDDIPHWWRENNFIVHSGWASAWAADFWEGYFTCDNLDASDANAIYVDFWFMKSNTESTDFTLYYYDGSNYDLIDELDDNGADNTWLHYTEKVTDSQYFVSNFRIRFDATLEWGYPVGENVYVDDVLIEKEIQSANNYELDLEVQWTSADYDETNEELCIRTGTFSGSEDLQVKVRSGGSWVWVMNLTANQWNNVSVTSHLTTSTFTVQFLGGTETGDTAQDSWDIDATLLHLWSGQYTMEVEFVGSSNTEDWTQLNWTVDSAWTVGSVSVTLQLYNYTLDGYPTSGNGYIAYTSNSTPNTDETKNQTITTNPTHFRNATGHWKVKAKGIKATDTQFDFRADWIELRARWEGGTRFTFENTGSQTAHLVSLWIINSTNHQRHDINLIINSAQTLNYTRADITLPNGEYTVKVVTKRGNTATYQGS